MPLSLIRYHQWNAGVFFDALLTDSRLEEPWGTRFSQVWKAVGNFATIRTKCAVFPCFCFLLALFLVPNNE
jgi:hypothetical protein